MSDVDLEPAIDDLYAADVDDFTERRNALAKELRGAGRRDDAERVKSLRKPTVAAWTVNQLARRNRRDVDLLLDAGHRAREAQRDVLGGDDRAALEQALQAERRALQTLVGVAREILRSRGSDPTPATLEKVSQTLRAAAVTDEGREAIAVGRLAAELEPTGFELFEGAAAAGGRRAAARERPASGREQLEEARARLKAATVRVREAVRGLKDAEAAAEDLRKRLSGADAEVESCRDELDDARREADEAKRALDHARRRR